MANKRKDFSNSPGRERFRQQAEADGRVRDETAAAAPIDRIQGRNSQPAGGNVRQIRRVLDDAVDATRTDVAPEFPGYSFRGAEQNPVSPPQAPTAGDPGTQRPTGATPAGAPPTPLGPPRPPTGPPNQGPPNQGPPTEPTGQIPPQGPPTEPTGQVPPQGPPPTTQQQEGNDQAQSEGNQQRRPSRWERAYSSVQYMNQPATPSELLSDTFRYIGGKIDARIARRNQGQGSNGPGGNGSQNPPSVNFNDTTETNAVVNPSGPRRGAPTGGQGGGQSGGNQGVVPGNPPPSDRDAARAMKTPWATKLPVGLAVGQWATWGSKSFPRIRSQENLAMMYSPASLDAGRVYTQHAYMRPTRNLTDRDREYQFNTNESEQQQWANLPPPVYREERPVMSMPQRQAPMEQSGGMPDWSNQSDRNRHLDVLHENLTGNPFGYDPHTRATAGYDTPNPATTPGIRRPRTQ